MVAVKVWQLSQFVSSIKIFISLAKIAPAPERAEVVPRVTSDELCRHQNKFELLGVPTSDTTLLHVIILGDSQPYYIPQEGMYWQLYLALLDGFCFDPSVALVTMLQAAKHNFYGCEKPRPGLGVFCSECFWSRPGLSQCESLLVIDCYTPTRNVNWDTHTQFDARSFRTSSVTPPYPCLCPNETFIRNPYLTNNQSEPHHANAKLSQESRPTFNEPVRSG